MNATMTKAEKARELRYKRPMLEDFGYSAILELLDTVENDCYDVHWWCDSEDGSETLTNALDGDEDQAEEFKVAYSDLEAKCAMLRDALSEQWDIEEYFDDCTVALVGNRYQTVGYDGYQEDYFGLTSYEQNLACSEAGKRVMRWTKQDIISKIGQCMGIVMSALDIKEQHERLSVTLDMLRGENAGVLKTIKEIDATYNQFAGEEYPQYGDTATKMNRILDALPDRFWIE